MPTQAAYTFSILIPSWNNLPYLRLAIESLRKNSAVEHEIIVHLNEGTDGSVAYLDKVGIDYSVSEENLGVCKALNRAFEKAGQEYVLYLNDDMYVCPGWDKALWQKINEYGPDAYFSSSMIEPADTANDCVLVQDYGRDPDHFREKALLKNLPELKREDWNGATWPPSLIHRKWWERVEGYSEEFSPGFYSDPDFSRKLWETGMRVFCGVGDSLVYHFMSRSVGRVQLNPGKQQFLKKWGITASYFKENYLKMGSPFQGQLEEPDNRNLRYWTMPLRRLLV